MTNPVAKAFRGVDYQKVIDFTKARLSTGTIEVDDVFDKYMDDALYVVTSTDGGEIRFDVINEGKGVTTKTIKADQKSINLLFERNAKGHYQVDYLGKKVD